MNIEEIAYRATTTIGTTTQTTEAVFSSPFILFCYVFMIIIVSAISIAGYKYFK